MYLHAGIYLNPLTKTIMDQTAMNGLFDKTKFANDVKGKRVREGFTLRTLAEATGVSHATINRVENEKAADVDNIVRLCNWLGRKVQTYLIIPVE